MILALRQQLQALALSSVALKPVPFLPIAAVFILVLKLFVVSFSHCVKRNNWHCSNFSFTFHSQI